MRSDSVDDFFDRRLGLGTLGCARRRQEAREDAFAERFSCHVRISPDSRQSAFELSYIGGKDLGYVLEDLVRIRHFDVIDGTFFLQDGQSSLKVRCLYVGDQTPFKPAT